MLDVDATDELTLEAWEALASRSELPCDVEEFLAPEGATPPRGDSRRQYHRFHLRERAFMAREGEVHAMYVKDVSRKGVGLILPMQLLPNDRATVTVRGLRLSIRVRRCRRLGRRCYYCGGEFAEGLAAPSIFKTLIQPTPNSVRR